MRILYSFTFLILFVSNIFAQENNSFKNDWVRYESLKKDFSIALPSNTLVNAENAGYELYNYETSLRMQVTMISYEGAKIDFLERLKSIKKDIGLSL